MAGVGFSSHFCEGEFKYTKIFSFSKHSCCTEEPEEDGCCSDQIKIIKLEKEQLISSNKDLPKQLSQTIFLSVFIYNPVFICGTNNPIKINQDYSPPLLAKKIPILYCSFLI